MASKRAIKILNSSIAIQDLALNKDVKGVDMLYLTKEKADKTVERVIMRMKGNCGASVEGGEFI